jgi:hypothetical protein
VPVTSTPDPWTTTFSAAPEPTEIRTVLSEFAWMRPRSTLPVNMKWYAGEPSIELSSVLA